jgi:hypothetical protein
MALRWSAQLLLGSGYKHGAPPEHFTAEQQSENDLVQGPFNINADHQPTRLPQVH